MDMADTYGPSAGPGAPIPLRDVVEAFLEQASDGVFVTDHQDRIALINAPAELLFGYDRRELLGRPVQILIPGGLPRPSLEGQGGHGVPAEGGPRGGRRASRRPRTGRCRGREVLFMDRLSVALAGSARKSSQVAVLLLDIDRFRLVNDSYGKAIGDRLLVGMAERLFGVLRPGDSLARGVPDGRRVRPPGAPGSRSLIRRGRGHERRQPTARGAPAGRVPAGVSADHPPGHGPDRRGGGAAPVAGPGQGTRGARRFHGRSRAGSRVEPGTLYLEIGESSVMEDTAAVSGVLEELRSVGVRMSIDDFGTGFSSLLYLNRFPIDFLKIDGSFVEGLDRDSGASNIVTAVISMAHALGMPTIAEGVETAEQLYTLRRLGCD